MVKIKRSIPRLTTAKIKTSAFILGSAFMLSSIVSCGSNVEYQDTEVLSPTQGVITKVKEMEPELYKITDETIVATKEDSRIIAEYIDGVRDTFTLEEAQLTDADNPRRRGTSGVWMAGMMGYMMGRNMSQGTSRAAYASDAAYNKSTKSTGSLRSTASRKTVRTPKKGFGSSRSTRSYGG
jgi:hypothetical protein